MKCVILAGGLGTRISEETDVKPKPMVEIGGMPLLWHIMKIYSAQGVNDFIVCLGYKGYVIKEFFANYYLHMSDVTFNMRTNDMKIHHAHAEFWNVTLVDTGDESMTGGRLKRVREYLGDEDFHFTYGDGLSNVDLVELQKTHEKSGRLATVTAVLPPGRYGALELNGNAVKSFKEKPPSEDGWINGGYFMLSPRVIDYIAGDETIWEQEPLKKLAEENQLTANFHRGFWQPMDTLREKRMLEELWGSGDAPWKLW